MTFRPAPVGERPSEFGLLASEEQPHRVKAKEANDGELVLLLKRCRCHVAPHDLVGTVKTTILLLGALALAPIAKGQAIYSASEQARPGSTITVRGSGLTSGTSFTVYAYTKTGARRGVVVSPSAAMGGIATLRLPSSPSMTVYEVTATTPKGATNPVFVNRPRVQWIDVPDALPGGTVRLIGRNFSPAGVVPGVTLVNTATKSVVSAKVLTSSDAALEIQAPAATSGTYSVVVNNGLAGAASASVGGQTFVLRPTAADPFRLGVGWGADCNHFASKVYDAKSDRRLPAHLAGNGKTEDGAAFGACLKYISEHGGGVLQLPAGTYRCDNGKDGEVLLGNTVVRGAGKGKTILQVGYVPNLPDYHCPITFTGANAPEGIMDLTIRNLNRQSAPNRVLNTFYGNPSRIFLKNVDFQMGNAYEISLPNVRKAVIADCRFTSTAPNHGTLSMGACTEVQYVRNTESHRAGRLFFLYGQRIVLANNVVHFDNAFRNARSPETGGVDLSYDQQVLLLRNEIGALGSSPARSATDGEVVLTQLAESRDFMYTGLVKSSSGTSLAPTAPFPTTAWQDPGQPSPMGRMAVFLVSGTGAGQWRRALSWTASEVTLERMWQVPPDSTTRFAIVPLNNDEHTYVGNKLFGGFYGIEWEHGAIDSTIEGNTLTNTGFVGLLGYTLDCRKGFGAAGSNYSFNAAWNNSVLGNTVVNTTGVRPATIALAGLDLVNLNLGPLVLGTDVRGNTITGMKTVISAEVGRADGIEITSLDENFPMTGNETLVQGTIVQDNVVSGTVTPVSLKNTTGGAASFVSNARSGAVPVSTKP